MKNLENATARPWVLSEEKKQREQWATGGIALKAYKREYDDYCAFAILRGGLDIKDDLANAALIVRAVNSHDALVEALEALMAWHDHPALTGLPDGSPVAPNAPSFDDTVNMCHAALKLAKGE